MRDFIQVAKALADPTRTRILAALQDRELCGCQIAEFLNLAASTVSKHMSVLRNARLVEGQKVGRWVYYRRAETGAPVPARTALDWVDRSLAGDPALEDDARRLKAIMAAPAEEQCSRKSSEETEVGSVSGRSI